MTPEVKRAYATLMEAYDALRSAFDKKRPTTDAEAVLAQAAERYYSELYCPARNPKAKAADYATGHAIAQCHDLVAMMKTWKPIYA